MTFVLLLSQVVQWNLAQLANAFVKGELLDIVSLHAKSWSDPVVCGRPNPHQHIHACWKCVHPCCADNLKLLLLGLICALPGTQPSAQDILRRYSEVLSTEYNGRICAKLVCRIVHTQPEAGCVHCIPQL